MAASESTSYGYASCLRGNEDLPTLLDFLDVAKCFRTEPHKVCMAGLPAHLKPYADDMQDLKAYGVGLRYALVAGKADASETAEKLWETAERMRSLMWSQHEMQDPEEHIGVMSNEDEAILMKCLNIYSQGDGSPSPQSREELEEAIICKWKKEAAIRCKLQPEPPLSEDFMQLCTSLGFVSEKLPSDGPWAYVLIGGATLPAMWRRCHFLQRHWERVRAQRVLILASQRPTDAVDFATCSCPGLAHVQEARTEADLARLLLTQLRTQEKLWSLADVVESHEKAGFLETFNTWFSNCPEPGSILVVSQQPHLRRMELQMRRRLLVTDFKWQRIDVIGEGLATDYAVKKSSILLDAIAHWVQIQREGF